MLAKDLIGLQSRRARNKASGYGASTVALSGN
jgi:hypothetical protein